MGASTTLDVLGAPYSATTFTLRPDFEGDVVATLVHKPAQVRTDRAVLYVHGFCDYFFQEELAQFWNDQGDDFYALDLRKYGRSLRAHQTPCFTTDLTSYYEELDVAWAAIAEDHRDITVVGHSTGGLIVAMWLTDRELKPARVILNSPWLDMQGDLLSRRAIFPLVDKIGRRSPLWAIPRNVSGLYGESLHKNYSGAWDYNLEWKPVESFPVRAGWVHAIRAGHHRVAQGLNIQAPVLVLASARSSAPKVRSDARMHSTDIVLDVEQIRRRTPLLGSHTSLALIEGALHDVFLSAPPARAAAYAEVDSFIN